MHLTVYQLPMNVRGLRLACRYVDWNIRIVAISQWWVKNDTFNYKCVSRHCSNESELCGHPYINFVLWVSKLKPTPTVRNALYLVMLKYQAYHLLIQTSIELCIWRNTQPNLISNHVLARLKNSCLGKCSMNKGQRPIV